MGLNFKCKMFDQIIKQSGFFAGLLLAFLAVNCDRVEVFYEAELDLVQPTDSLSLGMAIHEIEDSILQLLDARYGSCLTQDDSGPKAYYSLGKKGYLQKFSFDNSTRELLSLP